MTTIMSDPIFTFAVGIIVGLIAATILWLIYDYLVRKEVRKIFHELDLEVEKWKKLAMENDKDE